jgi:hypothetical protein
VNKTSLGLVSIALASTVALGGCTASDDTGISLADTKSSVQLMRNDVTGKVSDEVTKEVTEVGDGSVGCGDEFNRRWRSTALIELLPDSSSKIDAIAQTLQGLFVAKGWVSGAKPGGDGITIYKLTSPDAQSTIDLTATELGESGKDGATIHVEINGPCVLTEGPGSDELARLTAEGAVVSLN